MSFNSDYQQVLFLLELMEKTQEQILENEKQHTKMIRICMERIKYVYEQRLQEVGSSNGDTRP